MWEIDEGRYLVTAQNAIKYGKWIVPEYNGGPRIEKPPLMVWLVAASSIILNHGKVNEFTARLPSSIAAILVLVLIYVLVKCETQREDVAVLSAFLLSTSLLFVKHARFAITDMVLLFFITLSILLAYLAVEKESPWYLLAAFASCGLGYMDKGPVGLVIPAGIILLWCYSEKKLDRIPWKWVPLGILIFAVLTLWWPILVGPAYWEQFLIKSNIKRAFQNPSWKTSTFFYILNFPAHFILPSAGIIATAYALRRYTKPNIGLFAVWFAFVFVLFSISDTKRSSYILPLYPAAATLVGWGLVRLKSYKDSSLWFSSCNYIALALAAGLFTWWMAMLFKYKADPHTYFISISWFGVILLSFTLLKKRP